MITLLFLLSIAFIVFVMIKLIKKNFKQDYRKHYIEKSINNPQFIDLNLRFKGMGNTNRFKY